MARSRKKTADDPAAKLAEFSAGLQGRLDAERSRNEEAYGEGIRPVPPVGLRLPHLCLRYLFRMKVLPFCRDYVIYGVPRSCKSALLYEIDRWFVESAGYYFHFETESKDQSGLRRSVLRYPDHIDDRKWAHRCESIEMYQRLYYGYTKWMKDRCAASGVGRRVPCVFGIDSLVAVTSERTVKAFVRDNDGAVSQRFGDEANSLSRWLKFAANALHGWPFILVGVNHDKTRQDDYGNTVHHAPGGSSAEFHATTRVLVSRIKDLPRLADGTEGVQVALKVDKNSASVTGQRLEVDFRWRATGPRTQDTWWDWDAATTRLIETLIEMKGAGERGQALWDLLALEARGGGRYACPAVGVPRDDPQPPAEVGRLIEASAELMPALERALEIRDGIVFGRGDDMADYMAAGYEPPAPDDPPAPADAADAGGDAA